MSAPRNVLTTGAVIVRKGETVMIGGGYPLAFHSDQAGAREVMQISDGSHRFQGIVAPLPTGTSFITTHETEQYELVCCMTGCGPDAEYVSIIYTLYENPLGSGIVPNKVD